MRIGSVMRPVTVLWLAALLCACNGGGSSGNSQPPPPAITLTGVTPNYGATSPLAGVDFAVAGQAGFQLLAGGSGFTSLTVLEWNGTPLPTNYVDSQDINTNISSSQIAEPGSVTIVAKDTGTGATSNSVKLGIASPATLTAGVVQLVSAAPDGSAANGNSLVAPSVSATGRYVAFQDDATNLASGVSSGQYEQIYERDTCVGASSGCTPSTILITVTYDGSPPNFHSKNTAISADGRYVAFDSQASNILPSVSPCGVAVSGPAQLSCVYLRDTCTGVTSGCTPNTTLLSTTVSGGTADGGLPAMTPDARYVAFASTGTAPGVANVYLRDTCNGAPSGCTPSTILVSASPSGAPGNQNSLPQAVSATGRYVAFDSYATNLVSNPPAAGWDHLYPRDTCIGAPSGCTPSTIQLDPGGSAGLGAGALDVSVIPGISADGRFVAFSTNQVGFVSQNVQGYDNVYIRDTCNGVTSGCTPATSLISLGNDGSIGNAPSQVDGQTPMTPDGRFFVFESLASNLVPGDTFAPSAWKDIFVRDTCHGAPSGCVPSTVRVSVADTPSIATQADAISDYASISADGHYVVFLSSAANFFNTPTSGNLMVYLAKTGF
jgi:archaellum component FlaF (FlaF/FlaG flagellin family)